MNKCDLAKALKVSPGRVTQYLTMGMPWPIEVEDAKEWRKSQCAPRRKRPPYVPMGVVYFIRSGDFLKIGWAKNLQERIYSLQIGNPETLKLVAWTDADKSKEGELHKRFGHLHFRGEWFRYEGELKEYVQDLNMLHQFDKRMDALFDSAAAAAAA